MGETTVITGLLAWIALSLPFAALATTILLALRRRRPGRQRLETVATGRYGAPIETSSTPPPPAERLPAPPTPTVNEAHLRCQLSAAERRSDQRSIATLSIALARQCRSAGEDRAAGDHLRHAIRAASSLGDKRLHGEARLELGDLAEAGGDLTTACEHWQMARALLDDPPGNAQGAAADARMRDHGCPTDWVLNDF